MNGTFLLIILFLVVAVPSVAGLFVRRQIRTKGKFGLGPLGVVCPNCRSPQPFIREPNSFKQMMFGAIPAKPAELKSTNMAAHRRRKCCRLSST